MAYVIAATCVSDFSCVEICPVNAIHPGPSDPVFDAAEQLYIDPDTCINCGVCVEACPVLAIYDEGNLPKRWRHYAEITRQYFLQSECVSTGNARCVPWCGSRGDV